MKPGKSKPGGDSPFKKGEVRNVVECERYPASRKVI